MNDSPGPVETPVPVKGAALTHEVEGDGELVVFDQAGNQLLVLNEVGAAVWLLIDGQRTVHEIAGLIVQTLPAPLDDVVRDVGEFLKGLRDDGLVELR